MLRPRFFTAQPLAGGATLVLEKEPSRHIARALRMRVGDALCLFDGSGSETRAEVAAIERDRVTVQLHRVEAPHRESPLAVTLAIAMSRGDRMDTVVQKATELGVRAIWPLISERTGVRLEDKRLEKKRLHWERIAISACEQCGRNRLPALAAPVSFRDALARASGADAPFSLRLLLQPGAAAATLPQHCDSLLLLTGPEGGFSDAELEAATAAGFRSQRLGPRILRTETAPLAAIAVAQARWGDFELD